MEIIHTKPENTSIPFKDLRIGEMFTDEDNDLCVKVNNNKKDNTIVYLNYDDNPFFFSISPFSPVKRIQTISITV